MEVKMAWNEIVCAGLCWIMPTLTNLKIEFVWLMTEAERKLNNHVEKKKKNEASVTRASFVSLFRVFDLTSTRKGFYFLGFFNIYFAGSNRLDWVLIEILAQWRPMVSRSAFDGVWRTFKWYRLMKCSADGTLDQLLDALGSDGSALTKMKRR